MQTTTTTTDTLRWPIEVMTTDDRGDINGRRTYPAGTAVTNVKERRGDRRVFVTIIETGARALVAPSYLTSQHPEERYYQRPEARR